MYGKCFGQMYDGTLRADWMALVTFQQFIILADRDGFVDMHPEAINGRTGIPLEVIEKGIAVLEAPDPSSRTPDEEGRRIVRIDEHRYWGWHVVNYQKYLELANKDAKREADRMRLAGKRGRVAGSRNVSQDVAECRDQSQSVAEGSAVSPDVADVAHVDVDVDVDIENQNTSRRRFTDDDVYVATQIFEGVKVIAPSTKQPSIDSWADTVRLMRERDGHESNDILSMFMWANNDSFWAANILSPKKLREKWPQLEAQQNRKSNNHETHQRIDTSAPARVERAIQKQKAEREAAEAGGQAAGNVVASYD